MKKLIYPMLAFATLAMTSTSCSDELDNGATTNSNEAVVSFNVQLDNKVGSRATTYGDGTTATELHYYVYKSAENTIGDELEKLRGNTTIKEDLTAEVTFTLVKGQTYNFLFWAQCKGGSKYYTIAPETGIVTVSYADDATTTDVNEGRANNEERDAFFKVHKNVKITGPINETITLKRPFAQVNVGTQVGSLADAAKAEVNIKKSSFIVKDAATQLNTYSGAATDGVTVSYSLNDIIEDLTDLNDNEGDLKNVEGKNYEYLAMNYILVSDEVDTDKDDEYGVGENKQLINAEFQIYDDKDNSINKFEIPNVPVQRNYRTNIIGDILNETVTFNIVIDPNFANDHNYYTEKELAYAFASGGEVTLDPTKEYVLSKPLVANGKNVIVNLNGATIKNTTDIWNDADDGSVNDWSLMSVQGGGTLTIRGEGTIQTKENDCYAIDVRDGSTLNIEGGKYTGNITAVYVSEGTANIKGGEFSIQQLATGDSYEFTLNCLDANYKNGTAKIVVTGGKFNMFDPSNNAAEGAGTSFVPTDYKAINTGTAEAPVYEVIVAPTTDTDGNVALAGDGYVMESISVSNGTLDGNGYTLSVNSEPTTNALINGEGSVNVKNVTIEGGNVRSAELDSKGEKKSTRALYFTGTMDDVIISNVHVSGVGYALNVNSSNGTGELSVSNSTLEGWTSFAAVFTEAKFTNVHFGIGTYFGENSMFNGGIRPYMTTVFENCTFEQGFYISWEEIDATESLTFKNCKVGETVLDATNITTLLEYEGIPAENSIKFQ